MWRLKTCCALCCLFLGVGSSGARDLLAQEPPYDLFPDADPPFYRVRYEASQTAGELIFAVNYTIWIPEDVETLRGIVVHQHGCGEGSCKSGLSGAYDLHWQALARKHECALLAPAYEQPQSADCQMWCDPRNGSAAAFDRALAELGKASGHAELTRLPLALWGHSGGGHWCGGIVLTQPERVAAAWLRSGVPFLEANPDRPSIKPHRVPDAALRIPIMCNLGTKEGVTVKDGRFAGVWPANLAFFRNLRGRGGLVGVAVDPLTSHECGNSRYLAIPWLDRCLQLRLPDNHDEPLKEIPSNVGWLSEPTGKTAFAAQAYSGNPLEAAWLPGEHVARKWMQYQEDTGVPDETPPPAPSHVEVQGNQLRWQAEADLESGIAKFIVIRDGKPLAEIVGEKHRFGRPVFQSLLYSDTPSQPIAKMEFTDTTAKSDADHSYSVVTVNTVGLKSKPTAAQRARG